MRCNVSSVDPLMKIRSEFERQMNNQRLSSGVQMSILEADNQVVVEFDVPGFQEENLSILVESDSLTVAGERKSVMPESAKTLFSNREHGVFRRVLKLDKSINPEAVDAVLKNGVLTVTLQRRVAALPKQIAIRTQSE